MLNLPFLIKEIKLLVFLLPFLIGVSCKKDKNEQKCYQVRYIMNYCPQMGVLVDFIKPNPDATEHRLDNGKIIYQAAFLNIPDQYHVKDKIFYVKYHYDKNKEKELRKNICQAIFSPVKILVGDYTSVNDCETP
ncbi:hypothetical protein [Pedobacter foliorum]|uniref:hypothetical protein n=1 Tax=Pedobacter foliorum TaxID=2739058 RepID=UPI001567C467|nr:hypothetical protein [Pedobacter foliorum]NRF40209.1 hypothetical protein [Pedobacter foliorum]